MNNTDHDDIKTRMMGLGLPELVDHILCEDDVDISYIAECAVTRKLTTSNLFEIAPLLRSPDRFHVVVGLRILDEMRGVEISALYPEIDLIFARNDIALNRLCMGVICGHGVFLGAAVGRVAQFFDDPDLPTRRRARLWLLKLSLSELEKLPSLGTNLSEEFRTVLDLVARFRRGDDAPEEFLRRIQLVDPTAHREFSYVLNSKSKHLLKHYDIRN